MKKCEREDLSQFLNPGTEAYYPNSMCFKDKTQMQLSNNWFDKSYSNLLISIDQCEDPPEKPKACKSPSEIKTYMEENFFYVVS